VLKFSIQQDYSPAERPNPPQQHLQVSTVILEKIRSDTAFPRNYSDVHGSCCEQQERNLPGWLALLVLRLVQWRLQRYTKRDFFFSDACFTTCLGISCPPSSSRSLSLWMHEIFRKQSMPREQVRQLAGVPCGQVYEWAIMQGVLHQHVFTQAFISM